MPDNRALLVECSTTSHMTNNLVLLSYTTYVPHSRDRDALELHVWENMSELLYEYLKDYKMILDDLGNVDIDWSGQLFIDCKVSFWVDPKIKLLIELLGELNIDTIHAT